MPERQRRFYYDQTKKEIGYKADGTYHDLLWIIHVNLFHDAAFYGRNDIAEYMILSSYAEDLQKTFEYYNDWNIYKKENIALIAELIRQHRLHELYFKQNNNRRTPIDCVTYTIDNVIYQAVDESKTNAENNKVDLLV